MSSSYTPFAKESFIDELAHFLGRDPLQFRMDLLAKDLPEAARVRNVLHVAANAAEWGKPLPSRHGRGIASLAGDTCNAQVAEVAVDDDGTVHVLRFVSAVDCGLAVNPDGVRAMTEGGINFALTAVLTAEITIKDSVVEQSNFHDYQVLRINKAPKIDVHLVHSLESPSGVGERFEPASKPAEFNLGARGPGLYTLSMSTNDWKEADTEVGRRLAAAYISYVAGRKGVDRTLKEISDRSVGAFWVRLAATIREARTGKGSALGPVQ